MIKLQLRWLVYYFTAPFNAQRKGKALSTRTLDSERRFTPLLTLAFPIAFWSTGSRLTLNEIRLLLAADTEKRLLEFVGFCKKYIPERDRDWRAITLIDLVSCPWRLAFYMAFQMKRGHRSSHHVPHLPGHQQSHHMGSAQGGLLACRLMLCTRY